MEFSRNVSGGPPSSSRKSTQSQTLPIRGRTPEEKTTDKRRSGKQKRIGPWGRAGRSGRRASRASNCTNRPAGRTWRRAGTGSCCGSWGPTCSPDTLKPPSFQSWIPFFLFSLLIKNKNTIHFIISPLNPSSSGRPPARTDEVSLGLVRTLANHVVYRTTLWRPNRASKKGNRWLGKESLGKVRLGLGKVRLSLG